MNELTRHTSSRYDGYGFAYFAWMRVALVGSYRQRSADRGLTFFRLFLSLQPVPTYAAPLSDEHDLGGAK